MTEIKRFNQRNFKKKVVPITVYEKQARRFLERKGLNIEAGKRLYGFYPDLRIKNTNLLIEIDGGYHNTRNQRKKDWKRTKILESYGYVVIRFSNDAVLNEEEFVNKVFRKLEELGWRVGVVGSGEVCIP
jgi:very-short-patch-repair endonuclease